MESEPKFINVDEPFLSQQAFRDFLKLPSEEPAPKVEFYDLLKVAKALIKNELACCGCSEKELISCRLEYAIPKEQSQELGEIYSVQWSQIPQPEKITEDEEEISEEPPNGVPDKTNPLSSKFMGKLTQRLDEMNPVLDGARLSAMRANFRMFRNSSCRSECYKDQDDIYYLRWFCNGNPAGWVVEDGERVICPLGINPRSGGDFIIPID